MNIGETYIGKWWLPSEEESEFQGVLTVESNGDFVLNFLKDSTSINFEKKYRNQTEFSAIVGIAKENKTGKEFSFKLLNAYITYSSISRLSNFKIKTYSVLRSKSSEFSTDLKFDKLSLRTDLIDDWFNIYGYDFSIQYQKKQNFKLQYLQPDPIKLYTSNVFDIEAFFSVGHNLTFDSEFTSKQLVFLNLYFHKPKSFEELKTNIRKIRDFFTLANGAPINIHKTVFTKEVEGKKNPNFNFDFYQKSRFKNKIPTYLQARRMLINYDLIKNSSQDVFLNWFEKYDKLKFLMNNYFGSLYNEYKYTEDKFLDFIFSIEVYHRGKYGGFNFKNDAYLKIRSRILNCIDNSSDKQWLEARLKDYTENTLQSRLKHILEINELSLDGLIENKEEFLKQVVETRHYHVHSFVKNEEFVVRDVVVLSQITRKLGIIIQAVLLSELGFEQDVINKRLKKNSPIDFN
ncbi:hypothetical protein MHL31_12545 [Lutibacter sp. A80]|uniref:ApeA N-terminal domain 1-containing protein n=1 Tax=Lutibacter sp. A80 TaxID=2918453 RepID=UPI001F051C9A|nr:HEPN domain-containing protein [Lutibacter sp. A80]UMB59899.1 hypothetical protein MHL31_12545 [Lutibacter sp. A80]